MTQILAFIAAWCVWCFVAEFRNAWRSEVAKRAKGNESNADK